MKICIFGAGVMGSLYAARLQAAGHDVSILARGKRLQEIHERGLILEDVFSGQYTVVPMKTIETLNVCDQYDYIIVLVRNNQVSEALATVGKNIWTPSILVMVNNVAGYQRWIDVVGRERLMVGFAGAGGTRSNGVVKYALAPAFLQPTTLAELDGGKSERLMKVIGAFREAGFPTTTSQDMDSWQKVHAAWVGPLAQAIYMARNEGLHLADSRNNIRLMVQAIRSSLAALNQLNIRITPLIVRLWQWLPMPLLVETIRIWSRSHHFNTLILERCMNARNEIDCIAQEFNQLIKASGVSAPALNVLRQRVVLTRDIVEQDRYSPHLPT